MTLGIDKVYCVGKRRVGAPGDPHTKQKEEMPSQGFTEQLTCQNEILFSVCHGCLSQQAFIFSDSRGCKSSVLVIVLLL